jgi:hypothetical protein
LRLVESLSRARAQNLAQCRVEAEHAERGAVREIVNGQQICPPIEFAETLYVRNFGYRFVDAKRDGASD